MARMKLKELESHLQQVDEFESPKILLGKEPCGFECDEFGDM